MHQLRESASPSQTVWLLIAIALTAGVLLSPAQAQTFSVIHTFTGAADGATPYGTLSLDSQGNLYGTASAGGFRGNNCRPTGGCGTVFKLARKNGSWIFSPLYSFQGNTDAATPFAGVTIGPNGSLYGTTYFGGVGLGTAYNVRPPAHFSGNVLGGWNETVIYTFGVGEDGSYPGLGNVIFDPAGNMYGTTSEGGAIQCTNDVGNCGTVFKLTPSGGGWTESVFNFPGGSGGGNPLSGVVRDSAGNLYGTTGYVTADPIAYQLTPSGQGWMETPLYTFASGTDTRGGVTLDGAGGLHGTTVDGIVYHLAHSGGTWTYSVVHDFSGPGGGIWSSVVRDDAGNLYGTTCGDGVSDNGTVFKLTPTGGGWTETDLYKFTGGSGGSCPLGGIVRDAAGNIYGTTTYGGQGCGSGGCGVVWELTSAAQYTTDFPLTENPISENGNWTNGQTTGLDWQNCRTTTNFAFGTQDGSGGYDDSTCIVNGSWGPVQTATGTVHVTNQTAFQEVELRLHTTITPHSITGYEINLSVGSNRYAQVVRWNGPLNDFTYLDSRSTGAIHDGDVLKATIDASGLITVYINNVQQFQVTDTTYTTGNPGMGFYSSGGTNSNFGFSHFTATSGN